MRSSLSPLPANYKPKNLVACDCRCERSAELQLCAIIRNCATQSWGSALRLDQKFPPW